jgi:hypothetical protein
MSGIRKTAIQSIGHIHVVDSTGLEYFGCNQEWYTSYWRRFTGCGPSTASTLLIYLQRSGRINFPIGGYDKKDCKLVMDSVWPYVNPTVRGVNTSDIFVDGIEKFASVHGFSIECQRLVLPHADGRPSLSDAVNFIENGLRKDCPVAFLNLHNGKVKNLESWHWLTIVQIARDKDLQHVEVTVFDGDSADTVDFKNWYETTARDGALVYLVVPDREEDECG